MSPSDAYAPLFHGGDIDAARKQFPGAPQPFVDLSTGINPNPYPIAALPSGSFTRLPGAEERERLAAAAADAYAAPSPRSVLPTPGTQILLSHVARLVSSGKAAVLATTYAEHARAAALAGHDVSEVTELEALGAADLAIVVNPNNPDGRVVQRDRLLGIASRLRARGGLLLVDEAFMDAGPEDVSLAGDVSAGNMVVLRSFGKFYGLAGLRLGFAIASEEIVARLGATLGPWPVSGPAIAIGTQALRDDDWRARTRASLAQTAFRLTTLLSDFSLTVTGGTDLFRLVRTEAACALHEHLARNGILVRAFAEHPDLLRFGLPAAEGEWSRLRDALAGFGR